MLRYLICLLPLWSMSDQALGSTRDFTLPGEFEAIGDRGLALNHGAAGGLRGPGAARVNPALLVLNREYTLSAAYNWDRKGRDFYQLGVVDGTTESVAAGVLYTGFQDSYQGGSFLAKRDSPVLKRGSLGVAIPLHNVALGLAGHYVEAVEELGFEERTVKGITIGAGALANLTPQLRLGLSVENLNNTKVQNYAPTYYRVGFDWQPLGDAFSFLLDYRQRQRIAELEGAIQVPAGLELDPLDVNGYSGSERMILLGSTARFYGVIQIAASYGHAVSEDKRRSLAGSIGLFQNEFSVTYTMARPYLGEDSQVSSLSLTILLQI